MVGFRWSFLMALFSTSRGRESHGVTESKGKKVTMVLMVIALVVLLTHTLLFSQVMTRRHPHILLMERKRCAAGIIASTWNEERTNGARVLCSRLEKLGFPCQVWPAYDGRTMSSAELMKLARSGTDVAPGPKRGWRGREGFDGVSNLANVLSHINLARHFARMEEEKEESFDCYMMFEDDAAITESFAPEFYSVLHTLEERNMKWDVLNLHGARKVAANSFACIFSDIVDSRWVGGSYTRSLSLIFSRNGLKKFLSLLPIDTHIGKFLFFFPPPS